MLRENHGVYDRELLGRERRGSVSKGERKEGRREKTVFGYTIGPMDNDGVSVHLQPQCGAKSQCGDHHSERVDVRVEKPGHCRIGVGGEIFGVPDDKLNQTASLIQ